MLLISIKFKCALNFTVVYVLSFDIETYCPGFKTLSDIPTEYSPETLSIEEFYIKYEKPHIPVILKGAVKDWPASHKWTKEYLIRVCGDKKFRATSATAPLGAQFTMKQYFKYVDEAEEEAPLYLFERDFLTCDNKLAEDYWIPSFFSPKPCITLTNQDIFATDLFRVFGNEKRPDYRWFIAGPKRSGSLFHIDQLFAPPYICYCASRSKFPNCA